MERRGSYRTKRKRRQRRRRMARRILITLAVSLLAVYLGIAVYFIGHFSFNTYVNGSDAFKKTADQLEEEMRSGIRSYSLSITGRNDVTDSIASTDIELEPRFDSQYQDILKSQNPFLWPVYLFKDTHLTTETVVEYSDSELEKLVGSLALFDAQNITPPVDAHISDEPSDEGFYVVPEDNGCTPIKDVVFEKISAALDVLEPEIILGDECYLEAGVKGDDETMNTLCSNLNKYCGVNLVYHFGDDEVRVDGSRVREWCDINGTEVTFNEEKVRDFVNLLARTYDTFGKTRKLKTHSGETVDVSGGDFGWWMDRATETKELIQAIYNGEKGERTPVYFGNGKGYGDEDWGEDYVEINLDAQHLWVYKEGKVVEESDFVSGCVNKRRTTPVGTYSITYKERDATLKGENYSSDVKFWMPFNGNVGMHDASWRSSFGGEIYVTNGSHGCINLPTKKAESIYGIVTKGEPVLVYGGKVLPEPEEEEEEPTPEQQLQMLIEAGLLNPDGTPAEGAAQPQPQQSQEMPQPQPEEAPQPQEEPQSEGAPEEEGVY